MSRPTLATLAGLVFVLVYIVAATAVPEIFGRMHWAAEALYWCVAGVAWVFPIRWLMLWSVYRR